MVLQFVKVNPTQNMTVLVTSLIPRASQPEIAARLMAYESLSAEQVGFVEPTTLPGARARLQMMGGEFCGNASMSLAAWIARGDALAENASEEVPLEVSGAKGVVPCRVTRKGDGFRAEAAMPLPEAVENIEFAPGMRFPVVRFPGIAHAIVPESALSVKTAEDVLLNWAEKIGSDAFGILLTDAELTRMRPLVGVLATNTRVWERGCASGTAALGAFAALRSGKNADLEVQQPGGCLRVRAVTDGGSIATLTLSGTVRIVAAGEAYL